MFLKYDDLTSNLNAWFEDASSIASLSIACLRQQLAIIVPSNVGIEAAIAFSLTIEGELPLHIEVSGKNYPVFEMADLINESPIKTVFISGLIDSFNETAIGTLQRMCPEKHFWFGFEDKKTLDLVSKGVFNNALPLLIENNRKIIGEPEIMYASKSDINTNY